MKNWNIIAAIGNRGELGKQNHLLCRLPKDLKNFQLLTTGHTVLMGRHTWDSLFIRPLPNRRNIVLSTSVNILPKCEVFATLAQAMQSISATEQCFVIGGASIYEQTINQVDTLYLTRILSNFEADVFFPLDFLEHFILKSDIFVPKDKDNAFDCRFQKWIRCID